MITLRNHLIRLVNLPLVNRLSLKELRHMALMLTVILISSSALANRVEVNKNKVSDLFEKEVDDKQAILKFLEDSKKQSEHGIASTGAVQALGVDENALEGKTSELNAINVNNLESKGQEERAKEENSYVNQLEVDYLDPKIINHKKDIDKIADSSSKLMSRLIEGLRDLDIDCKTVKGDKELEPEYAIEIEKEHVKDTVYNQQFCEELRNKYSCTDTVTVKCTQKTKRELKPETIRLAHHEMPDHWWIGRGRDGGMCYGAIQNTTNNFALFNNSPEILAEVKQKIVEKIGNGDIEIPNQEIMFFQGEDGVSLAGINSSGRVVLYQLDPAGNKGYVQNTWHPTPEPVSGTVRFFYKVPQEERCIQWHERWDEVCRLQ